MKRILAVAAALLWSASVSAQTLPCGPTVTGHLMKWSGGCAADAGSAAGGPPGSAATELGIIKSSPNGVPPLGILDAPITALGGYHWFNIDVNPTTGLIFDWEAMAGATQLPFVFKINGTSYTFPFTIGGVLGPNASTVNEPVVWNNTVGSLLKDGLNAPILHTGTFGVVGATTLIGTLGVSAATTLSSTLHAVGATTLDSTLAVAAATTLSTTLAVASNFSVSAPGSVLMKDLVANQGTATAPTIAGINVPIWAMGATGQQAVVASLGTAVNGSFAGMRENGTTAAPTKVLSGNLIAVFGSGGAYGPTPTYTTGTGGLAIYAAEDWTTTTGTIAHIDTVGIGAAPPALHRVSVTLGATINDAAGALPTGGDKGAGTLNVAGGYYANGTAGITKVCVAAGATLTFTNGLLTSTAVC